MGAAEFVIPWITLATGAWAPADIQQRVPVTRPEMSLSIKGSIYHQKVQDFEFKFHFLSKNWVYLESNSISLSQTFDFPHIGHLSCLNSGTTPAILHGK